MMEGGQSGEAVESASSDFAFGSDLFIDTVMNETTTMEPATEGVGAKIIGAIKSIFNAIGNFFKNLFSKNKKVQSSIKSSSSTTTSTTQAPKKTTQAPKKEDAPKSSTQQATPKSDSQASQPSSVKQNNTTSGSKPSTETDLVKEMQSFIDNEVWPIVEKQTNVMLNKMINLVGTASNSDMKTAITLVSQKFDKIKQTRLYKDQEGAMRLNNVSDVFYKGDEIQQHLNAMDKVMRRLESIASEMDNFEKSFEDSFESAVNKMEAKLETLTNKINALSDKDRDALADKLEAYSATFMKRAFAITVKGNPNVYKALDEINNVCKNHTDFCQNMMKGIDENSSVYNNLSDGGKGLFQICKKYLAISKTYGKLTIGYQKICSGISLNSFMPESVSL